MRRDREDESDAEERECSSFDWAAIAGGPPYDQNVEVVGEGRRDRRRGFRTQRPLLLIVMLLLVICCLLTHL